MSFGWQSLESVRTIHAVLEVSGLALFAALVVFEVLEHRTENHKNLFTKLALLSFALAVASEIAAYPYSRRIDTLTDLNEKKSEAVINAQSNQLIEIEAKYDAAKVDLAAIKASAIEAKNAAKIAVDATAPKPLKVRILGFLNSIDPKIIEQLRKYKAPDTLTCQAKLSEGEYDQLKKLAAEPGASKFLSNITWLESLSLNIGWVENIRFDLSPALLE